MNEICGIAFSSLPDTGDLSASSDSAKLGFGNGIHNNPFKKEFRIMRKVSHKSTFTVFRIIRQMMANAHSSKFFVRSYPYVTIWLDNINVIFAICWFWKLFLVITWMAIFS